MLNYRNSFLVICFFLCCSGNISDRDNIINLYSGIIDSYQNGDLRGVMKPISEDFYSMEANEENYQQVREFFTNYFRDNSQIAVQIRDMNIEITETTAEVSYEAFLNSRENSIHYKRKDFLEKNDGNWEVMSWEYLQ